MTRWVYFRKKASDGDFELFSDTASKAKYMSTIYSFVALLVGLNLFIGVQNLLLAIFLPSSFNYIGLLNLTIGIWGIFGTLRLRKKRNRMKQEAQLFE